MWPGDAPRRVKAPKADTFVLYGNPRSPIPRLNLQAYPEGLLMSQFHRTLSLLALPLLIATVARAQLPVLNDDCVNAIQIGDGTVTGTTIGSTISINGCGSTGLTIDVWYSYTATRSGLLALDTCGSSFDTSITLYASCTSIFELACNDDAPQGSPCGYP